MLIGNLNDYNLKDKKQWEKQFKGISDYKISLELLSTHRNSELNLYCSTKKRSMSREKFH